MKKFTPIVLLAAALFGKSTAQAADTLHASHSSLEIVLNFQKALTFGTNVFISDQVVFSAATNITMEVSFRNVGEVNMEYYHLLTGLAVVWDGKEYKRGPKRSMLYDGERYFSPKTAWRLGFSLSDYRIPTEALASGRHTVAVKDAGSESNILTIFIDTHK
jgi:hypothetical protein